MFNYKNSIKEKEVAISGANNFFLHIFKLLKHIFDQDHIKKLQVNLQRVKR